MTMVFYVCECTSWRTLCRPCTAVYVVASIQRDTIETFPRMRHAFESLYLPISYTITTHGPGGHTDQFIFLATSAIQARGIAWAASAHGVVYMVMDVTCTCRSQSRVEARDRFRSLI